jgi:hypothetical protein
VQAYGEDLGRAGQMKMRDVGFTTSEPRLGCDEAVLASQIAEPSRL